MASELIESACTTHRTRQAAKPYFREWKNMRYHEGKTFLSNPRLFKRDKALYFPNLYGITLASPRKPQNTTPLLRGKISVVNLFSSLWAEQQVATFMDPVQNSSLHEALQSGKAAALAQKVDICLEENAMKAWLVRMFMWRMRQSMPVEDHKRYFLVRKGLTDELKEAIGMMNSKVGYIYLVDDDCRIRWAGSGPAQKMEIESLNSGLRKLIEEKKSLLKTEISQPNLVGAKRKIAPSP
jgi:mitochondrial ATPase complex subunit ATP10